MEDWVGVGEGVPSGSKFGNVEGRLPQYTDGYYREFAVNPRNSLGEIDGQRFVVGQNGEVYYSSLHYENFVSTK
jgi:guanyl-specific ribonuclease Sa